VTFKTLALVLAAALLLKTCLQQQHGLPGLIKGGLWERSGPLGEVTASEVAADMWAPGSQARIAPGRMLGASANLNGKLAVVTGANTGLGKETARVLASQGCHVVLACRNEGRCREAASDIMTMSAEDAERGGSVEVMQLDLASLASVRAFAEVLLSKMDEGWGYNWQRIDFLINNAGIVSSLSVPPSRAHALALVCSSACRLSTHFSESPKVLADSGVDGIQPPRIWACKLSSTQDTRRGRMIRSTSPRARTKIATATGTTRARARTHARVLAAVWRHWPVSTGTSSCAAASASAFGRIRPGHRRRASGTRSRTLPAGGWATASTARGS